jgi:hypothetical protein
MGYQERDWKIVDYQRYPLDGTGLQFRGPPADIRRPEGYFACIGAAQTFGCFCTDPFTHILSQELGLPALNLGYAGAGPCFYLKNPPLMGYIKRARFVVVQVMSGRSESNRLFDSGGVELLTRRSDGQQIGATAAYRELLETRSRQEVADIVAETRDNWVANNIRLMEEIPVPKVLFWFAERSPDYQEQYKTPFSLFGGFPQLVNRAMIDALQPHCDRYVECVTKRGMPQPLISRFTGKPTTIDSGETRKDLSTGKRETHNTYYPSPEMQQDAAAALLETCRRLV